MSVRIVTARLATDLGNGCTLGRQGRLGLLPLFGVLCTAPRLKLPLQLLIQRRARPRIRRMELRREDNGQDRQESQGSLELLAQVWQVREKMHDTELNARGHDQGRGAWAHRFSV